MSSAHQLDNRMTAAEYLEWERQQTERHEFVNGEVFLQAGGTRRHSLIGANLNAQCNLLLKAGDCEAHGSDMRIHVEATGMYAYPDVSVACPPIEGESDDVISNPVLLAEVLSPSTADYDRGSKFGHYRQIASLREYLVIWQSEARVEHHQRAEEGHWLLHDVVGLDAVLQLTSLNVQLPLAEVYDKVALDQS